MVGEAYMSSKHFHISLFLLIGLAVVLSGFTFLSSKHFHKDIPLTHERELKVTLDAGFGDVSISRGKLHSAFDADIDTEQGNDFGDFVDYTVRDDVGYLEINTSADVKSHSKKHSINFESLKSNEWDMRFPEGIPISFEIGLGLGKGDFDLSGLNIKDLKLSAGASSVAMRFNTPNRSVIEDLTIESGLSKFVGEGLCNANFNHLKFEGGVGSYTLDFGGELKKEVDVDIEVGLGSLVVRVPEEIGVRIIYEKSLLAHIDIDRSFTEEGDNSYFSPNYKSAQGRMNVRIQAGLGSVKVRRNW